MFHTKHTQCFNGIQNMVHGTRSHFKHWKSQLKRHSLNWHVIWILICSFRIEILPFAFVSCSHTAFNLSLVRFELNFGRIRETLLLLLTRVRRIVIVFTTKEIKKKKLWMKNAARASANCTIQINNTNCKCTYYITFMARIENQEFIFFHFRLWQLHWCTTFSPVRISHHISDLRSPTVRIERMCFF